MPATDHQSRPLFVLSDLIIANPTGLRNQVHSSRQFLRPENLMARVGPPARRVLIQLFLHLLCFAFAHPHPLPSLFVLLSSPSVPLPTPFRSPFALSHFPTLIAVSASLKGIPTPAHLMFRPLREVLPLPREHRQRRQSVARPLILGTWNRYPVASGISPRNVDYPFPLDARHHTKR